MTSSRSERALHNNVLGVLLAACAALAAPAAALAHGDVMRIGSSQPGGGQLRIEPGFQFDLDVVLPPVTQVGGMTLYSTIFPSFTWVHEALPADNLYPLNESVTVRVAVAAPIDSGASMRMAGRTLNDPGEEATIGAYEPDPEAHVHPEWQLILANGVTGRYEISFVLTTSAAGYTQSPLYTLVLTNIAAAATATPTATLVPATATPTATAAGDTPSPTATAIAATATATEVPTATDTPSLTPTDTAAATVTATAEPSATPSETATQPAEPTATAPACPGDCDGNGVVSVNELIRGVGDALMQSENCPAVDFDGSGSVSVGELVRAVRAALDGCAISATR